MIASAFTCTGPYAVLIMLGIKRVENRSLRPVPAKGRCAVGCSKSFCREEYGDFVQWAARLFRLAVPIAGKMEVFFVLPLDAAGHALSAPVMVALGHETGTTAVDPREVFREALNVGAEKIIVAHNHPSGDLTPSKADIATTARLREAGEIVGVALIDHLIVGCGAGGSGRPFASAMNLR